MTSTDSILALMRKFRLTPDDLKYYEEHIGVLPVMPPPPTEAASELETETSFDRRFGVESSHLLRSYYRTEKRPETDEEALIQVTPITITPRSNNMFHEAVQLKLRQPKYQTFARREAMMSCPPRCDLVVEPPPVVTRKKKVKRPSSCGPTRRAQEIEPEAAQRHWSASQRISSASRRRVVPSNSSPQVASAAPVALSSPAAGPRNTTPTACKISVATPLFLSPTAVYQRPRSATIHIRQPLPVQTSPAGIAPTPATRLVAQQKALSIYLNRHRSLPPPEQPNQDATSRPLPVATSYDGTSTRPPRIRRKPKIDWSQPSSASPVPKGRTVLQVSDELAFVRSSNAS